MDPTALLGLALILITAFAAGALYLVTRHSTAASDHMLRAQEAQAEALRGAVAQLSEAHGAAIQLSKGQVGGRPVELLERELAFKELVAQKDMEAHQLDMEIKRRESEARLQRQQMVDRFRAGAGMREIDVEA